MATTYLPSPDVSKADLVHRARKNWLETRLQKTPASSADGSALSRILSISRDMFKQEGARAFYKGITPRIMRVAPGQAVTFTVYEFLKEKLDRSSAPWNVGGVGGGLVGGNGGSGNGFGNGNVGAGRHHRHDDTERTV